MTFLATRSIPLRKDTRDAWTSVGVRFVRRDRDSRKIGQIAVRYAHQGIINLGNTTILQGDFTVPVWTDASIVRSVSSPLALRRMLNDYIPERTTTGSHWHKSGGFGGVGTTHHLEDTDGCARLYGDIQRHIDGDEYRIITVGNIIVQASMKENVRWINGRHSFDWNWVGVDGVRRNGIIPHVKQAVELIPNYERSILGWDIIVGDRAVYTLEINTSPGVNRETAGRIVRAINTR